MDEIPSEPDRSATWLTKAEVGHRLGVGTAKVTDLIDSGLLEAIRLGYRTVRVSVASVEELQAGLTRPPQDHHGLNVAAQPRDDASPASSPIPPPAQGRTRDPS